jgi:hypothetical protein
MERAAQPPGADCLQRPLRSRFRQQVSASVSRCNTRGHVGKPSRVGGIPHQRKEGRLFVIFGESHLAVRYPIDFMVCSLRS